MRLQLEGRFLAAILAIQTVVAAILTWSLIVLGDWEQLPDEIYRNSPDAYLHYNDARVWVIREQGFIVGLFVAGLCHIGGEWRMIAESPTKKRLALVLLLFVPVFLVVAHSVR
jgi:hypothetical protein